MKGTNCFACISQTSPDRSALRADLAAGGEKSGLASLWLLWAGASVYFGLEVATLGAGTVEPVGPPLPATVIDFYVPPTRYAEPYTATAQAVYRLHKQAGQWRRLYAPADPEAKILGITGYAKSSEVLYLAHTRGGALTRDSGKSWQPFEPLNFAKDKGSFVNIAVNPKDRKNALMAFQKAAWITSDYGQTLDSLSLPTESEIVVDIGYGGSESPFLVMISEVALYQSADLGKTWMTLMRAPKGPQLLALSSQNPVAIILEDQKRFRAYDLLRPGYQKSIDLAANHLVSRIDTDAAGRGIIWGLQSNRIYLFDLKSQPPTEIIAHESKNPITSMKSHPRLIESLYWTEGAQLYLLGDGFSPDWPSLKAAWDLSSFNKSQNEIVAQKPILVSPGEGEDPHELLNNIMAAQPPLEEVVAAALRHAHYHHGEVASWKKRLRNRYWMPQLRVGYDIRQFPTDRSRLITQVDRFGVSQVEDLRLSDEVEDLDRFGVFLTWDLSRLLFDPEQVDLNKEKRFEVKQRNDLIVQITKYYYDRLDLLLKFRLQSEKMPSGERTVLLLKIRHLSDLLNGLSGDKLFDRAP